MSHFKKKGMYLAENKDDVLVALGAKKAKLKQKPKSVATEPVVEQDQQ
mgnify:CR=1 FL=1